MEHYDTLLTFAEIAVALAGFTGLVSVMGRRERQDTARQADWFRLRLMLEVALRNAAFALLPIPFLDLAQSETMIWRIASGIYLLAVPAHILLRLRQNSKAAVGRALSVRGLGLLPISLLACAANVTGLGGSHAFSLYLLSLLLGLITAGMLFVSVAGSLFNDEQL